MRSRRDVLGVLGTAAVASTVGCLSSNSDGDGGDTDEVAPFHDWLGPGLLDVSTEVNRLPNVTVRSPGVAANNGHLEVFDHKYLKEDYTEDGLLVLSFEDREITLDVDIPDLEVHSTSHDHEFWIYSGSFDADVLSEEFADAPIHEEYRDHQIMAEPLPDDMSLGIGSDQPLARCVAFNDNNLIIAHVEFAEDGEFTENPESRVTEFTRAMLDTHDGAADRFVDTNEEVEIAADEFDDGWYTLFYRVGRETLSGDTIKLDGDTATRRAIKFFEYEDEAADFWWLDEDSLESAQEPPDTDDVSPVPAKDIHEEYDEIHARQEDRYVMLEATLSADEIVWPEWRFLSNQPPEHP